MLWASFVIETPGGRIYFVADSGYGEGRNFRELRERYGPFRLAILPIGAYEPRWFMRDQHMNPDESVQALDRLRRGACARPSPRHVPTDRRGHRRAAVALAEALAAAGIAPERFRVLRPGQVWEV